MMMIRNLIFSALAVLSASITLGGCAMDSSHKSKPVCHSVKADAMNEVLDSVQGPYQPQIENYHRTPPNAPSPTYRSKPYHPLGS